MKRFLLALAALALAFPAAGFEYKTIDVRRTGNSPVRESFYAGDSIGFGYYLTEDNETYDLTEWDMVTWEIASYTNSAECWMSVTGRIDNAEGGEISVETMLPLSVVPVGQYKGYVKAVKLTAGGDAVASQRTVVEQTVQVRYGNTELSPDAIDNEDLIAQGAFVRQAALDAEMEARIGADAALSNAVAGVRSDVDGMGETVLAISNKVAGLDGDLPDFSTFATKEWTETNYIQRELVEPVKQPGHGGSVTTGGVLTVYYDPPGQSLYVKHLRVDQLTDYNGNAIAGTGSGSGGGTVAGDYLPAVKMPDGLYHVDEGAGTAFGNGVSVEGDFGVDGDVQVRGNLTVYGQQNIQTIRRYYTNVYVGTQTNYVTTEMHTTNHQYQYLHVVTRTTNNVDEVINIGGDVDHSRAATVLSPSYSIDNSDTNAPILTAAGFWDYTVASLALGTNAVSSFNGWTGAVGIQAGSNIVFGTDNATHTLTIHATVPEIDFSPYATAANLSGVAARVGAVETNIANHSGGMTNYVTGPELDAKLAEYAPASEINIIADDIDEIVSALSNPVIETPDHKKWAMQGRYVNGQVTHVWVPYLGVRSTPIRVAMPDGRTFEMVGRYADGNTNVITHAWQEVLE